MTLLKINGLLPIYISIVLLKFEVDLSMATINMHIKFEIEIPKQTWLMLRKPCRLQTDGRTDRRTDGQGESSIPPYNFVGRGYNKWNCTVGLTVKTLGYPHLHIFERIKYIFDAMCYSPVGPYPIFQCLQKRVECQYIIHFSFMFCHKSQDNVVKQISLTIKRKAWQFNEMPSTRMHSGGMQL